MMFGLGLWLGVTVAHAGAIPATREVLGLASVDACPTVPDATVPLLVRTSVGLMASRGDGTYAFGCPDLWGGGDPKVATNVDATEIWYAANGKLLSSTNGGCTLDTVALPEGQGAVDVIYWRDAFWALTVATDGSSAGALLKWDGKAFLALVTWDDFRPTAMLAAPGNILWVTSVDPRARVRRLDFTGGISGDSPLGDLPDAIENLVRFEPTAADDDEAWFTLELAGKQWTWHAETVVGDNGPIVIWTQMPERKRLVLGPVKVGDSWLASIDNVLNKSDELTGVWTPTSIQLPWTCLGQQGDTVLACTVDNILQVDSYEDDGTPNTTPVFSFAQVAEPDAACSNATCDRAFTDFLTDADLLARPDVAVCPDGTTAADLAPGGCDCDSTSSSGAPWLGATGLLWALRRRRGVRA